MENSPKQAQEHPPELIAPENNQNKYFEQEEQEGKQTNLDKTEVQNRIANAVKRIALDIETLNIIRSKLGLPPATDEDIINLPAFSHNLANLKKLREMEEQIKLASVTEIVTKKDIPSVVEESEVAPVTPGESLSEPLQENDTNVVVQLPWEDSVESVKSFSNVRIQDKAPFLRDAIDLIKERDERIKNEVNSTQNIDAVQKVAHPEVPEIKKHEIVPETKTEEVVPKQAKQESEVEEIKIPENNMEPKNNHNELVVAPQVTESIPPSVAEQPLDGNKDKEVNIENLEAEAVYIESIKNFTNSYKGFFENLLRYNESTLQKNGEESSDSILYNGDINSITKDLDGVLAKINNKDTAKIALEHMVNINSFLMDNLFPIKGGMSSASIEGYDFLGKSIDEIGASLVSFYGALKATKQEGSVQEVATLLSESLSQLKDVQEKKLGYVRDYLSR